METWPGEWLRGVLDLCVLAVVAEGPTYGYAIATRLETAGLGVVKGGTLYPLLGRLEDAGLVSTRWSPGDGGPGRKYVTLTAAGRAHLSERSTGWRTFIASAGALLATAHTPAPAFDHSPDRSTR